MQSNNNCIHCKVICEDQIRRFQLSGIEFSSLQNQIKKILGLDREFVLKYKDNEDDMITVSTTDELACAIELSPKNNEPLLRLVVTFVVPTTPSPIPANNTPTPVSVPVHLPGCGRENSHQRGCGRGGKWGGGRGGCRNSAPENLSEKRRAKFMLKREFWKTYLSSLEQKEELTLEEENKKQRFLTKLARVESVLGNLEETPKNEKIEKCTPKEPVNEKIEKCSPKENQNEICPTNEKKEFCQPKEKFHPHCDKGRRHEKKSQCEAKNKEGKPFNFSEEAKAEITVLKSQMKEMKPAIWACKDQLKEKKMALRAAKESGQLEKVPQLKMEIQKLKEENRARKAQMAPLCQKIHELKHPGAQRIKGAIRLEPNFMSSMLWTLSKDKKIYLYCTCVNEGTSSKIAHLLIESGFEAT